MRSAAASDAWPLPRASAYCASFSGSAPCCWRSCWSSGGWPDEGRTVHLRRHGAGHTGRPGTVGSFVPGCTGLMAKNTDDDTVQTEGVKDCPDCRGTGDDRDGSLCQTCGGATVVPDK